MNIKFKKVFASVLALLLAVLIVIPQVSVPASALSYSGSSSYMSGKYYTALKNVQLTGNQRTDIVNVARSQIGYQEGGNSSQLSGTVRGNGNCTEYGRWYGLQDMWCAMFVSWCANVAGISTSVVPKHSYTPTGLNWFKSRGQAYSRATVAAGGYTPQPGDIIYFKSPRNSNPTNHIGIVTGYSGRTVYTVEGNTSSATVSTNGGAVAAKSYSITNTYIVYICKPSYSANATPSYANVGDTFYARIYNPAYNRYVTIGNYEDPHGDIYRPDQAQVWKFERQGSDNAYKITNMKNNLVLDLMGGNGTYGTNIITYDDVGSDAQRWLLTDRGNGGYTLSPKAAPKNALDIDTGGQREISCWDNYAGPNQIFRIDKVSSIYELPTGEPANLGDTFYTRLYNAAYNKHVGLVGDEPTALEKSGADSQIWKFQRNNDDGSYKITNLGNGKVLDLANEDPTPGNEIITWDDNGYWAQRWYIVPKNGGYVIQCKASKSNALDIDTGGQTGIANWEAHCGVNQIFQIEKLDAYATDTVKSYANVGDSFYARIYNPAYNRYVSIGNWQDPYADIYRPDQAQVWKFERQGSDNAYKITNMKNNLVLDLMGGNGTYGTNIITYDDVGSDAQRWLLTDRGNGGYTLSPKAAPYNALDIDTGSQVEIACWDCHAGVNQVFTIEMVSSVYELSTGEPANLGDTFYTRLYNSAYDKYVGLVDDEPTALAKTDDNSQIWKFELDHDDNSYKITNVMNGKNLDLSNEDPTPGTEILTWEDNGCWSQRWYIVPKNGGYVIQCKAAKSNALDIDTGGQTGIANWEAHCNENQIFQMDRISLYTVNHYTQNFNGKSYITDTDNYTLASNEKLFTDIGSSVTADVKSFAGYITPVNVTTTPDVNDSTVINYYYMLRYGDVNCDEVIDANDTVGLIRRLLNGSSTSESAEALSDVNGDGKVTLSDLLRLKLYLADSSTILGSIENENFVSNSVAYSTNIGNDFYAKLNNPNGGFNLSLSSENIITDVDSSALAQVWHFVLQSDNTYKITNMANGLNLSVTDGLDANGAQINMEEDTGTITQRWNVYAVDGGYNIRPAYANNKALTVENSSTETVTQLWDSSNKAGQLFNINIQNRPSENFGDDFNARINYPAATGLNLSLEGDNVIVYTESTAEAQIWNFVRQLDGSYKIVNSKNGKCLNADGTADGTNVSIAEDNGSDAQRWYVYAVTDGYRFAPKSAIGASLDVTNESTEAGANLQIWTANSNAAQVFTITEVIDETVS